MLLKGGREATPPLPRLDRSSPPSAGHAMADDTSSSAHAMAGDAAQRLRQRHGQGMTAAAVSLGLNLDALRMLPQHDAMRAIELAAAVRTGTAWRGSPIGAHEYALLAAVMSTPGQPEQEQHDPDAAQHANAQVVNQLPHDPEPPGTISRSRSRPA